MKNKSKIAEARAIIIVDDPEAPVTEKDRRKAQAWYKERITHIKNT